MKFTKQQSKRLRFTRKFFGITLIIIGIAGVILPIFPGWIFIFIGLGLLGINIYYIDRIKDYIKKKYRNK